jgi:hypothetical protein
MGALRTYLGMVAVASLALAAATPALAQDPPPPTPPSIDQYVETVPTAGGGTSPEVTKQGVQPLPAKVATRLHNSSDATTKELAPIATSSAYGAPQTPLSRPAPRAGPTRDAGDNALSSAVSAVGDSSDSHVFWLLGAVIIVTTSMVWAAARRHRA